MLTANKFQLEDKSGPSTSRRPRIVNEDHESIVAWPGEEYMGTVYPDPPTGYETARCVYEKLKEYSLDNLQVIGGDNTSSNTGPWNGAFRYGSGLRIRIRFLKVRSDPDLV